MSDLIPLAVTERTLAAGFRAARGRSGLGGDVLWAMRAALRGSEARRAMTRTSYGLGVALAVVAAVLVQAAAHAWR